MKGPKEQSIMSSIVSWIATGNNLPSFIDQQSCAEFPWYTYAILNAETNYELDIRLWSTIQKELFTNPNLQVELALRKALAALKLDVTPAVHRLSIYRWAHQALDMELDHPVLPLVWQQFFLLYLGRLVIESGLPQRGSVGEKFFDSVSNVSLIKRMKKRLNEAADYHHKVAEEVSKQDVLESSEEMQPDSLQSEGTAPLVENTDTARLQAFHQKLVGLYQTMSFWLDEPRLHDPKLYLPALPQEYQAEKLLTLFHNQKDPWLEYVDMPRVDTEVSQMAADWEMHLGQGTRSSHKHKSSVSQEKETLTATERILERLKQDPPLQPPPVMTHKAPVPEVNSSALCDKQTLLYALRGDFNALVEYAKLYSMRTSKHVAIDCTYLELLPSLYRNEPTEVNVSIPCQSVLNPLHRCKGPAVISCQYDAKTTSEITSRKVAENRAEYKQLMIESLLPPPQNICSCAVHVENAITALINLVKATGSSVTKATAIEVGISLFYQTSSMISVDTKYYPPTRQFFSACIEILGQEFIRNNPTQSQPLLQAILQTPSLVGLLAPNFSPNASPDLFVNMYEDMIMVPGNQGPEVAFTLLTKFDVSQWLEQSQPPLSQRNALIEIFDRALTICGFQPDENQRVVFEVYRVHLQQLLAHRFPEHYGEVLRLLLKGSENSQLHPSVWTDFLSTLGCSTADDVQEAQDQDLDMDEKKIILSVPHMRESMGWLSSHFFNLRVVNADSARFGLYPKWKPYVPAIGSFLEYLAERTITQTAKVVQAGDLQPEQALLDLWQKTRDLFAPWIQPLDNDGQILSPWIDGDTEASLEMVAMFTQAVRELQTQFEGLLPSPGQDALSMLWPYYATTLAKPGTPDHILNVYHAHLKTLPWDQFCPDLDAIQFMVSLKERHARCCFVFLGHIFSAIKWPQMIEQCTNVENHVKLHILVFQLLIYFSKEKEVMETTEVPRLLTTAESFNWSFLDATSYDQTVTWFLDNCDSRCVLAERTSNQALVLNLLKTAAGFVQTPNMVLHPETPLKRCAYMRCIVQLISRCSHLKDVDPEVFSILTTNLLTEVETIVGTIVDPAGQHQEAVSLCIEVLNLLNNCNPQGRTITILLQTIKQWVDSSPTSILLLPLVTAAGRTLASVMHMANVMEACIDAHFSIDQPEGEAHGWGWVLAAIQVPDLTQKEFLEECLQQGCYLTLFAYVLQKLPMSQKLDDELAMLRVMVIWTSKVKPRPDNEAKLFLWWDKILELMLRQMHFGTDFKTVIGNLGPLTPALMHLAEDKSHSGILGAIGLGKKSQLSQKFRLAARAMATFIQAQIPNNNYMRMEPNSPGAVTNKQPRSPGTINPSQNALQAYSQLEMLRTNKHYQSLAEHTQFALDFIGDPAHAMRDSRRFLAQLQAKLFPELKYLELLQLQQRQGSS